MHITAAAFGLSALIASSATAFLAVKYLGAGYLIYLGLRTLLRPPAAAAPSAVTSGTSLHRTCAEGVLINVLNPKVALFFLAFLPQFLDPVRGDTTAQILVLGSVLATLGLALDLVYAFAGGSLGTRLAQRRRAARRTRYFTGGVYLLLGTAAALLPHRAPQPAR